MKCIKCNKYIDIELEGINLCMSCYKKSAIKSELPSGFNSEENRIEQLALRTTKLYDYRNDSMIFSKISSKFFKLLQKKLDTSIKEKKTENIALSNSSDICFVCLKLENSTSF